jgi:hypothetical protein
MDGHRFEGSVFPQEAQIRSYMRCMKKFLITLFSVLVFAGTLIPAEAEACYNPQDGQWYYYYNGTWWLVQAPNTPGDTPQPPVTTGIHGYYWYPGHYGPTGVWYPGVWLAY